MIEANAVANLSSSFISQQSQEINNFLCRNHEFQIARSVSYFLDTHNPQIKKPSLIEARTLWPEKLWLAQDMMERKHPCNLDIILVTAAAFQPNGWIAYISDDLYSMGDYYRGLFEANPQATKIGIGFSCQMLSSATMDYTWLNPIDMIINDRGIYINENHNRLDK